MLDLRAFWLALGLLTRIPIPQKGANRAAPSVEQLSRSVLFYPLVGAVLGAILGLLAIVMPPHWPLLLQASLLLVVWVALSGGLHLDGLADVVDAAFAGHKNPQRIMTVMRDPYMGSMATVALVLVLLVKFALLHTVVAMGSIWQNLLFATILSRLLAGLYMYFTPYARAQGIASGIDVGPYRVYLFMMALGGAAAIWITRSSGVMMIAVIALGVGLYVWRAFWMARINGYSGDCVGALVELSEVMVLFIFVVSLL